MGCDNSSAKGDDAAKSRNFSHRLSKREPLAMAMRSHFDAFLRECSGRSSGSVSKVSYPREVGVNSSVESANSSHLQYGTAKDTASDFLGYAMECLEKKNWGGSIHSHLHGAEGRRTELTINGHVNFDTSNSTIEEPYEVKFKFFCANE